MKSLRLKRVASGALAIATVLALVTFSAPAGADPAPLPDNASEALQQYNELKRKAEKLNEEHLKAQDALTAAQKQLKKANADMKKSAKSLRQARTEKRKYNKVVDKFAGATYTGGHLDSMSLALSGNSTNEFLERSAAINVLAEKKNDAIERLAAAVDQAEKAKRLAKDARKRARESRDAAAKHKADITARKRALDEQIAKAKQAYEQLNAEEQAAQQASYGEHTAPPTNIVAPGPAAQNAVDAAMSQRGDPYVYGAEGPDAYDCSGLTSWSYRQAGISIPRSSSAQASSGTPVTQAQLQPGDLVFFYQPVSHVGMYIGDGKMVHAPQEGDVVKVAPVMWDEYSGARRYA
ncbi:C40 family peptidase [Haloechinothrix halophila]|uniref:C40 family peptidase n=1 Tax=Haloechinothrix halophila TaxID=1069073 RepID=UPI00041324AF|nr:C40 family peptidase [Haloechinothrix halophila]